MNAKYGSELNMREIDAYLERDKEEIRQRQKFNGGNVAPNGNPNQNPQ